MKEKKMSKHKYLTIITARGGSKGIPGKNIIPLNGKPLIVYSIEAFLNSGMDGDCYVTTDCKDIADISRAAGAKIIERPAEIAQDGSSSASAVNHVIETLREKGNFDYTDFILLQPTSPQRNGNDIRRAVELYQGRECGSVVSMTSVDTHPFKTFKMKDENQVEPLFGNEYLAMPRQNLPKILKQNGAIYIVSIDTFAKNQNFCQEPVVPYIMDAERSVDIDTPLDLKVVEYIMSKAG
jgi:CMP-N,N'-diacetyllegionaminic acid synthase